MGQKTNQLQLFMTRADEAEFSKAVLSIEPSVVFIDQSEWNNKGVPGMRASIDECGAYSVILLNQRLFSFKDYREKCVMPHPSGIGYYGAMGGPGMMLLSRSREPAYVPGCLHSGSLAAGYDADDASMKQFVRSVLNIAKNNAKKVYTVDPDTGAAMKTPLFSYCAWPDAAQRYAGEDGRYLVPDALRRCVAM